MIKKGNNINIFIISIMCSALLIGCSKEDEKVDAPVKEDTEISKESKEDKIVSKPKESNYEEVRVLEVIEGNIYKIKIKDSIENIRLYLVSTPSKQHLTKGKLPLSQESISYVKDLFSNAEKIEIEKSDTVYDSEGNLLVYLRVDGELLNSKLIEEGLGFVYKPHESKKYVDEFYKKESEARESSKFNIWDIDSYVLGENYNVEMDYDVEEISKNYKESNSEVEIITDGLPLEESTVEEDTVKENEKETEIKN